jgi:hypothetical protein
MLTCFAAVTHYFNALSLRRFVLIDTLAVRRTAEIFSGTEQSDSGCRR